MIFKPEDFSRENVDAFNWQEKSAEQANAKLQKLIDEAPTVYGIPNQSFSHVEGSTQSNVTGQMEKDTHKAKLMFIQELKKEGCKHDPNLLNQKIGGWFCRHCGVELKAEWKAVK